MITFVFNMTSVSRPGAMRLISVLYSVRVGFTLIDLILCKTSGQLMRCCNILYNVFLSLYSTDVYVYVLKQNN